MNVTKAINLVKYVADANGNKTDVLVPVEIWEAMLSAWKETIERLEDRENLEIFQEWLQRRDAGLGEAFGRQSLTQNQRFHVQMLRRASRKELDRNKAFYQSEIFDSIAYG